MRVLITKVVILKSSIFSLAVLGALFVFINQNNLCHADDKIVSGQAVTVDNNDKADSNVEINDEDGDEKDIDMLRNLAGAIQNDLYFDTAKGVAVIS